MVAYGMALQRELTLEGEKWGGAEVTTVFLGGGTPSIVPPEVMGAVLDTLRASFRVRPDAEFTCEANPGTLTEPWLETLLEHGMNRLSLGVQAAQDELLRRIGRIHTFREAREAAALARRMGVGNLNLDLMYGLPGQTPEDYRESIDRLCALEPAHLSAYSLILEEGTPLFEAVSQGRLSVPGEDATADFYQQGLERLEAYGYHQYEISNFAGEGFACRHNIGYWQGAWYLGLGVGAHSMLPPRPEDAAPNAVRVRRANGNDRAAYVESLSAGGAAPCQVQMIGREEAMFETIMLGLRMNKGVSGEDFRRRFGASLQDVYGAALSSLVRDGLGGWRGDRFTLSPRGLMVQNSALLRFLE